MTINLVEGQNELNVSLVPIPPAIDLVSLDWDTTPPFEPGSSHYWTVTMRNLVSFPVTYQLQMYMNGAWFMGHTQYLLGDEVKTISQPYAFGVEGNYTLTVKAYYKDELLDEISSTVSVETPPAPPVISAEYLIGYVWWEGQATWKQIVYNNSWPADTSLTFAITIKNTGNTAADFMVWCFGLSDTVTIQSGQTYTFQFTGSYERALATFAITIYANGKWIGRSGSFTVNFV